MLKKFSKFLLLVLLIFVVSTSSFTCSADEASTDTVNIAETNEEAPTTNETESASQEIHSGDLYLIGNEIVMDKLVDGNVFILANKVKITGQVNGNLYVLANKVTFDRCIIRYSIFICADYAYYNNGGTYEGDMYVAANTLETTYTSYIARDIKAFSSDIILKSAVGRDADLSCNTLSLGEGKDTSLIYGDLRYTSDNEISIPEGAIKGSATYNKQTLGNSIVEILIGFGVCVVTALSVYIILSKLAPRFTQNISNKKFSISKIFKTFGIGLTTVVIVSIFVILLAGTLVGIQLALILALLFVILCIIAMPVLAINITSKLKIEKKYMFYFVLALISIILCGITLIPFVGWILGLIINIIAIGSIVNTFLPHKELTDEEKIALEKSEKLAEENKEKIKQEKLESKEAKKQKKLEAKEAKKKNKNKDK